MWREILDTIKELRPPSLDDNGDVTDDVYRVQRYDMRNRRYRWTQFYWMAFMSGVLALVILFAWGFTPLYSGFALAGDFKQTTSKLATLETSVQKLAEEVKEQQKLGRQESLEGIIFDLQVKRCEAEKRGDSQAPYTWRIQSMQDRYKQISKNGEPYSLPTCDQLK